MQRIGWLDYSNRNHSFNPLKIVRDFLFSHSFLEGDFVDFYGFNTIGFTHRILTLLLGQTILLPHIRDLTI
jgi:hypothetical protein